MRSKYFYLLAILSMLHVLAQAQDHVWLENSHLKVRINADGRLFCDDEKGAFLVPLGDSMVSVMRGSSLWFAGIDPGNNLCISAQTTDPVKTDFAAGFRNIPNSGKVWKVTKEEIYAHQKDYLDNWVVDDPNPSIFGWPVQNNNFFGVYNGFQLTDSMANFEMSAFDYPKYQPNKGDAPIQSSRSIDIKWNLPSQMACFVFNSNTPRLLTGSSKPLPVQVWGQAFVYDCPENEVLSNSVFVYYSWRNEKTERLDSTFVSIFNDIDLGNPEDDYHGSMLYGNTYFAYNADSLDDFWGEKAPMFFVKVFDSPISRRLNEYTNEYDEYQFQSSLMPYGFSESTFMPGVREPKSEYEFYNYMTGTWRDGTPFSEGGTGYNFGNPPATPQAFPGYPDSVGLWTELNAQNPKGNRRGMLNFNTGTSFHKQMNQMLVQYTFMPWEPGTYTQRIRHWEAEQENILNHLYCCVDFFNNPLPDIGCESSNIGLPQPDSFTISPNPANEAIRVWHQKVYLNKMLLFDASGRLTGIGAYRDGYSEIQVSNLPEGIYFLQIEDEHGERKVSKVVVAHGAR